VPHPLLDQVEGAVGRLRLERVEVDPDVASVRRVHDVHEEPLVEADRRRLDGEVAVQLLLADRLDGGHVVRRDLVVRVAVRVPRADRGRPAARLRPPAGGHRVGERVAHDVPGREAVGEAALQRA
jgi:hypothetical protein